MIAALFLPLLEAGAQELMPRSVRSRDALKTAIEQYKRGDYESAASAFAQAQAGRAQLSPTEQQDLGTFSAQNSTALAARQDGSAKLHQAEQALKAGNVAEASKLLRAVNTNQFLSSADRHAQAQIAAQVQSGSVQTGQVIKSDAKSLLAAARVSLAQGDLDAAEALAMQAEKVGGSGSSWLQPWNDTPAKLRRDVQAARSRSVAAQPAPVPEPKGNANWLPSMPKFLGGGENPIKTVSNEQIVPAPVPPTTNTVVNRPPTPDFNDPKAMGRKMIYDGFQALNANDLELAKAIAMDLKAKRIEFDRNEPNPDQLLHEIQRRTAAAPAKASPAESRALVRQARSLLYQNKLEEAEKLCNQAAAIQNARWGLFEDTPDKVRRDLQTVRAKNDREASVRVLADARKLLEAGNLAEAKAKAYQAQKMHGPYGVFDFGDRPHKVLEEISRAELALARNGAKNNKEVAGNPKKDTAPAPIAKVTPSDPKAPAALSPAQMQAKSRAAALVTEARTLERAGMLFEARQKAVEAKQLGVVFGPQEDSPDGCLLSLAAKGEYTVQKLVQQATDRIALYSTDTARFQKAQADLDQARKMAQAFSLDLRLVEQKTAWVKQVATASGAVIQNPTQQVKNEIPLQPVTEQQKQGKEMLDKAYLELRMGKHETALRMAEKAFAGPYGVEKEASDLMRSIAADQHKQRELTARRNFDAGIDAYQRRDYQRASHLFAALDYKLLPVDYQNRLKEIMGTKEMLPQTIARVGHQEPGDSKDPAGKSISTDLGGNDLLGQVRAMEKIQFEQLQQRGAQTMSAAGRLFKEGQPTKAIEMLKSYNDQLNTAQIDADKLAQLRRPVEGRIQQFRTAMAQDLLKDKSKGERYAMFHDESKKVLNQQKTQEEVGKLLASYNTLLKEGKYKDAIACAYKAQEIDPENTAVQAAIRIATVRVRQKEWDSIKDENEYMNWKELNPKMGPYAEFGEFAMTKEAIARLKNRKDDRGGILHNTRTPLEKAIEYRLSQPISLNFKDTPLHQALEDIRLLSGVQVIPKTRALQQANINLDAPVTLAVENIPMKSAMNLLLDKMKLNYAIRNDVLEITTEDDTKGTQKTRTYPVADLVVPVDDHQVSDVNNLTAMLERHINSQPSFNQTGVSPYTGPRSLPAGMPVDSYSKGLGSAFGTAGTQGNMPTQTTGARRAPGQTMEEQLMGLIQNIVAKDSWEQLGGPGRIQYYPLGMALVVNQTQEVQEEIVQLLAALRRLQDLEVAIEMRIVTVAESFYERIGVDFDINLKTKTSTSEPNLLNGNFAPFGFVNRNLQNVNAVTGLTPAGTLTPDLNIPIKNSSFAFATPPFGGYPGTLGADGGLSLGLAFLSDVQVFMLLEAAQGDRRVNVMQAPKVTVFNGQSATISVQQQQFFLIGVQAIPVNGQIMFVPQNQPFPVGLNLRVTPVVSADRRFVRLNMNPNVTALPNAAVPLIPIQIPIPNIVDGPGTGSTQVGQPTIFTMFFQQPSFDSIIVNTTVNVPDGGTVLLGGLKTLSEARSEFGPPILSKIPYINRLFKNVGYGREAQSMMIMVTPRIIINEEEEQIFLGNLPPIPRP